jgi:broad specificity phosphatase PhoE
LPKIITLIRHGQSEGNVMVKMIRQGKEADVPAELFAQRPDRWRLTPKGVEQAEAAAKWLREHAPDFSGRCYVSPFTRAIETAGHIVPAGIPIYESPHLRERDWGNHQSLSREEQIAILKKMDDDPFYGRFPNGESMADACLTRADRTLDTLARECQDVEVKLFCHGETMWAFYMRLTQMRPRRFEELHHSKNPHHHIHNCQILQFTRVNPVTGEEGDKMGWMRSVCPWDLSLSSNDWQPIVRHRPTATELLAEAAAVPRFLSA